MRAGWSRLSWVCASLWLAAADLAVAQSAAPATPGLRLQEPSPAMLGARNEYAADLPSGQGLRLRQDRFDLLAPADDGAASTFDVTTGRFGAWDVGRDSERTLGTPAFSATPGLRLDAYRMTWRYTLVDRPSWTARIGFTGLATDARWMTRANGLRGLQPDTGVSPLLHASGAWRPTDRFSLVAEVEGMGLADRRIWDLGLSARYQLSENWHAGIGYRLLDTGAEARIWPSLGRFSGATLSVGYRF